jgi:glycosyltransferase involved in cell wall biosynthesis
MPIALIEAQQAGIPVIATNVGSTSEVVINNFTGIITGQNYGEIVEAINVLSNNPELIQEYSTHAVQRSKEIFSVKKMIEKHNRAYLSLTHR